MNHIWNPLILYIYNSKHIVRSSSWERKWKRLKLFMLMRLYSFKICSGLLKKWTFLNGNVLNELCGSRPPKISLRRSGFLCLLSDGVTNLPNNLRLASLHWRMLLFQLGIAPKIKLNRLPFAAPIILIKLRSHKYFFFTDFRLLYVLFHLLLNVNVTQISN